MTDRKLKRITAEFRDGILDGRSSFKMCAAVCFALNGFLWSFFRMETEIVEVNFPEINHCLLRLTDGRILDPTADQFGLEPVYLGPLPLAYSLRQARLAVTTGTDTSSDAPGEAEASARAVRPPDVL